MLKFAYWSYTKSDAERNVISFAGKKEKYSFDQMMARDGMVSLKF